MADRIIDWSELRRKEEDQQKGADKDQKKETKYTTDSYLGIEKLVYKKDKALELVDGRIDRSLAVVNQYKKAYERLENKDGGGLQTIEEEILANLLHPGSQKMVLIRLGLVDHAAELARYFADAKEKPFSVIHYVENCPDKLSDYKNKPTLVIVVDRLRMGERLPSNCVAYDVRSRYGPSSNGSTWIQDVGRCAGHHKKPATVYYSHSFRWRTAHNLLTPQKRPINQKDMKHPILTLKELAPYSLILDAEPQIGKTGVMLWLIHLLHHHHIRKKM